MAEPGGLPYRTAFETRLDYREVRKVVEDELRRWLRGKKYDLDAFDQGLPRIGPGAVLRYAATNHSTGWQLRESREDATWVTTVSVTHDGRNPADEWVSINVEGYPHGSARVPDAKPPRLVASLLDAMDAYDGPAELRARPILISSSDRVEELLEIVCGERRLPVVVAAPPVDDSFDRWKERLGLLMRDLVGLASMYVLDPRAAAEFNKGMSRTHRIGAGSVRTYLPGVDPAVDEDGLRHRILSARRIEAERWRARALLAALPRRLAAAAAPPVSIAAQAVSISDFARSRKSTVESEATNANREIVRLREEITAYEALLDEAAAKERTLNQKIADQSDEIFGLAHDLEVTQQELEHAQATVRALQRRLVEANLFEQAYSPVTEPPEAAPTSFSDLLQRLAGLDSFVVFTGDEDETLKLEGHAPYGAWARVAWQCVLAISDYAKAKQSGEFANDFKAWCESPPPGAHALPASRVARDESETVRTNERFARHRYFPVPATIDPSGRIFMGAHVRIARSGQISPRLYFYDATSVDGHVYIGYIGPHLPNTLTS
jgi:uncharacterized coiled-coil protein SlyX